MNDSSNTRTTPGRYIVENVQTLGMAPDRPSNPPTTSEEYYSVLQADFKSYRTQIDRTEISRFRHEVWSKIERRKHSNDEAIRLGVHRASVWLPQQLHTWSNFQRRRAAWVRWSRRGRKDRKSARIEMSPAEAALVSPGWAMLMATGIGYTTNRLTV